MKALPAMLLAVALIVGLTACAPETELEAVPAEVASAETATPEPTPTNFPITPLVIPACEDLIDLDAFTAQTAGAWEHFVPTAPDNYHGFQSTMGPKALEALEHSKQYTYCVFVLAGSFGEYAVEVLAAELDTDARDALISDLRRSDYVGAEREDGVIAFDYEFGLSYGEPAEISYRFIENAWIITMYKENRIAAELALDGFQVANPQLS